MTTTTDFADKIIAATTGVKLTKRSTSPKRTMSKESVQRVAELFGADEENVGGNKKFLDVKHPVVAPVYQCLRDAEATTQRFSMRYETGTRIMRLDRVETLRERIADIRSDLAASAQELWEHWEDIKRDRRRVLADLYDESEYAKDPREIFGLELTFPAIGPDPRMERLHPEIFARERANVAARMEQAVRAAEQAAVDTLQEMLAGLAERLQPGEDGKPKTLRQSAIGKIKEYCEHFKEISIGSNAELDAAVARIEEAVAGTDAKILKRGASARERMTATATKLRESLASIVIDRPARRISFED